MKKQYTFVAAALMAAASAFAVITLPYESGSITVSPGDVPNADGWTQKSDVGDTYWVAGTNFKDGQNLPFQLRRPSSDKSDDYLVSPHFKVKKGGKYTLAFRMKSQVAMSTADSHIDIYFTAIDPLAGTIAEGTAVESVDAITSTYTSKTYTFEASAAGEYMFAIRFYGAQTTPLMIAGIAITADESSATEEGGEQGGGDDPDTPVDPSAHVCTGKAVPYESPIAIGSSNTFDEGWTVIDNNGSSTWGTVSKTGTSSGYAAVYNYAYSYAADDHLVSPAIHLEAGKEYKVFYSYSIKNTANKEIVTLYASKSNTPAEIVAGTVLDVKDETFAGTTHQQYVVSFNPTETADYYFSFHCTSPKNRYNPFVSDFKVMENAFAPAAATDFTATPAPARELKMHLSWALPTMSTFGDAFTADQTIEKIEIYRDGGADAIVTLTDAATEFDDTEVTGLTAGKHYYSIYVTVAGARSGEAKTALSAYCGPYAPTAVPATFAIATADDFDMYEVVNATEKTPAWSFNKPSYGNGYAKLTSYSGDSEDSWLICPPIAIAEAGDYRATVNGYYSTKTDAKIEVYAGVTNIPAEMTYLGVLPLTTTTADAYVDFNAAAAGTYYVALRACVENRTGSSQTYYIYSMGITKSKYIPGSVTDLVAEAAPDNAMAVNVSWTCPTKSYSGGAIADYSIEVYLDGVLVRTLEAGATACTLDVEKTGMYTVGVRTITTDGEGNIISAPTYPTAKTSWVGPDMVSLPYSMNFEESTSNPSIYLWSILDANKDGKTWHVYSSYASLDYPAAVSYKYSFDDFLLSPKMELTPGFYKVTYKMSGQNVKYVVGLVNTDFSADNETFVACSEVRTLPSYGTTYTYTFRVSEAGTYRMAIGSNIAEQSSLSTYNLIKLYNFALESVAVLPATATDLAVTPDAEKALAATISWVNPTMSENIEGYTLANGEIVKAEVLRNGELAGSVTDGLDPGDTTEYVDVDVPAPGKYTYSVVLYTAGGKHVAAAPQIVSPWIGAGMTLPYAVEMAGFNDWTIHDANKDASGNANRFFVDTTYGLSMTNRFGADDWAVSPVLEFEWGVLYNIAVTGYIAVSDPLEEDYLFDLHLGNGDDLETVQTHGKYGNLAIAKDACYSDNAKTIDHYVYATNIDEVSRAANVDLAEGTMLIPAGSHNMAIHATDKCASTIRIPRIEVTMIERLETGMANVSTDASISYANGHVCFDGISIVEVYDLAGKLVMVERNACGSISVEHLASGVYVVRAAGKALKIVK